MPHEKRLIPAETDSSRPVIQSSLDNWKHQLRDSYTTVGQLAHAGLVSDTEAQQLEALGDRFQIRLTPYYAGLISPEKNCPIRMQALPHLGEEDPILPEWIQALSQEVYQRKTPWHSDAIGDVRNLAAPRLTHRYKNRAILHSSSTCSVYCRFCFRKSHLNDHEKTLYEGTFDPALSYIREHSEIREVILTGGDPLSATDPVLERLLGRISEISHIRTVRIHSRMPVTLPYRITPELTQLLGRDWGFHFALATHFNHPKELSIESRAALRGLKKAGITLLNQCVLLRGVNADSETLAQLFQELYELGVNPFYLHHPDWTPGTFHFRTSVEAGRAIYAQLKGRIPGPALPHYVLDIPQGYGKTLITDTEFRKVKSFENTGDSKIGCALYQAPAPATRHEKQESHQYLDLFPIENDLKRD